MGKFMKKTGRLALCLALSFCMITGAEAAHTPETLTAGGIPFGVRFYSEGIVVVGFTEVETSLGSRTPAYDAGLRLGDVITHVSGCPVKTSEEMIRLIEDSGTSVEITYVRDGDESTVTLMPSLSARDGRMKTGMWIRDTTAGIGTVTYINPETGEFAGLGHGICDTETGELLTMERGTVVDVRLTGISRGISGTPGELRGYFMSDKTGVLLGNTECGVYGVFTDPPSDGLADIPVGTRWDVAEGDAVIRCTLDDCGPMEYSVRISAIRRDSRDNRSFTVEVTDPQLLEKTGGIIQGMSGSPILQNGRLIGAVTHVLISDPAKGYGIFIENMLDAAG
ncbi:MAG: SpoIVB peptidase [Clostridia bacterium]|nr:SpoIVB peptidase [Clostridia bacterium]